MSNKKYKLLTISDTPLSYSGVANQARHIFTHLLDTGKYTLRSLGAALQHKNYQPIKVEPWGDDWIVLPVNNYGEEDLLRHIILSEKPDALFFISDPRFYGHLFTISSEIRNAGIPLLYWHVWDELPVPTFNKAAYHSCDFIGTISKLTHEIIQKIGHPDFEYIPHAVDPNLFYPRSNEERQEIRQTMLPQPGKFNFFYVSRNARRKNTSDVLRHFKDLLDIVGQDKAFLFMVTDPGDHEGANLVEVAKMLELTPQQICFAQGIQAPDLAKLYSAVDTTVCISNQEGYGLCLDPKSEIQLEKGKIKKLKDVVVGDKVLTSDGSCQKVLNTAKRVTDTLVIKTVGNPDIISSYEHPFYVLQEETKTGKWIEARNLKKHDKVAIVKPKWNLDMPKHIDLLDWLGEEKNVKFDDEYIWNGMGFSPYKTGYSIADIQKKYNVSKFMAENAKRLVLGLSIPKMRQTKGVLKIAEKIKKDGLILNYQINKIKRIIPFDERLLSFIGWYLAEGSNSGGAGLEINLHKNEVNVAFGIQNYLTEVFGIQHSTVEQYNNSSRIYVASCLLAKFMKTICGNYAKNKSLHPYFLNRANHLAPLIKSLYLGDGCNSGNSYSLTTISKELAWQVRQILLANNIYCSVKKRNSHSGFFTKNKIYTVSLFGNEHEQFCDWTGLPNSSVSGRKRGESLIKTENYVFVPIRDVIPGKQKELMDIQVESAKSFVANGVVVHNSSLESMSAGTPVISTRTGGLQDQNYDPETEKEYGVSILPSVKNLTGSQQIPWIYAMFGSDKDNLDAFLKMYKMSPEDRKKLGLEAAEYARMKFPLTGPNGMCEKWERAIERKITEYKQNGNPDRIRAKKV